jgi:hypothetical protein
MDGTRERPAIRLALPDPSLILRRRHPGASSTFVSFGARSRLRRRARQIFLLLGGVIAARAASAFARGAPAGHPRFEQRGTGAGPARACSRHASR